MPIEFRCPSCSRRLQTPDQAAGKRAKCPGCGELAVVPTTSSSDPPALEAAGDEARGTAGSSVRPPAGDPSSAVRTGASSSAPETSAAAQPVAPPSGAPGSRPMVNFGAAPQMGLPWECEGKSVASFWHTAKRIVLEPQNAFRQMRHEGLAAPLIFAVCGALCSSLILICCLFSLWSLVGGAGGHAAKLDAGNIFLCTRICGLMVGARC